MSRPMIAQLQEADAELASQMEAIADLLDGVAAARTEAAKARLKASADAVIIRLAEARNFFVETLAGVLGSLDGLAEEIGAELKADGEVIDLGPDDVITLAMPSPATQAQEEQVTVAACSPVATPESAAPPAAGGQSGHAAKPVPAAELQRRALFAALHCVEGAPARWDRLKATQPTNKAILAAIGRGWSGGMACSATEDRPRYECMGGKKPAFWCGEDCAVKVAGRAERGKPTLSGVALAGAAREVLGIVAPKKEAR